MSVLSSLFSTMRGKMWLALIILATSTMLVGMASWLALNRADESLGRLHKQTVSEVANALELSKRASDLATTAPFLLNLSSSFLAQREGRELLKTIDAIEARWPDIQLDRNGLENPTFDPSSAIKNMRIAAQDLIAASKQVNENQEKVTRSNAELSKLRDVIFSHMQPALDGDATEQLTWLNLQSMANYALNAGFSHNLLGVGEQRRLFVQLNSLVQGASMTAQQQALYQSILIATDGNNGIFELRRLGLQYNLNAQNALFRIRFHADKISDLASTFVANAEFFLEGQREQTSSLIGFARTAILVVGLVSIAVALAAAFYMSNYVAANIGRISGAMTRLAAGNRENTLDVKTSRSDEIGDLMRAFRVFRTNAIKLDRANNQLNVRNALFEEIFNNITDGVAITEKSGKLTAANPKFADIFQLQERGWRHKKLHQILKKSAFDASDQDYDWHKKLDGFLELSSSNGQIIEVKASELSSQSRVWLFSDVTERRKVEDRLHQIRHIESMGKVTGEVAHDFGNILSTISSNLFMLENLKNTKKVTQIHQRISNAVEIGTSLTQRLLAFARKQYLEPETVELNGLIAGLEDFIAIGISKKVRLVTELASNELYVRVDPGQLESAILNLCINSNQAIKDKGQITIRVRKSSKDIAEIIVSDTGTGMDEATIKQALEPFFTTREEGDGTGLGLSMVYGFIKQTGGDIQINSSKDDGTQVRLTLPIHMRNADDVSGSKSVKSILLVDDEQAALKHATKSLSALGMQVYQAASFDDANDILNQGLDFDVLLTDLQLDNGHSGWHLAEKVLALGGHKKVVVTSGNKLPSNHRLVKRFPHRIHCVAKPLTEENLSQSLTGSRPTN